MGKGREGRVGEGMGWDRGRLGGRDRVGVG